MPLLVQWSRSAQRNADLDEPAWYATIYQPPFPVTGVRPRVGSCVVWDLRIATEPSVAWEYSLTITNLFDKEYPDWFGFLLRGRAWHVTVAGQF